MTTETAPPAGSVLWLGIGVGVSPPAGCRGWLEKLPAHVTLEPTFTLTQWLVYCAGAPVVGNEISAPPKPVKSPPPVPAF